MQTSKKWAIDLLDAGKAFVMAVLTSVVGAVGNMIHEGHVLIDTKIIGGYALAGAIAYLSHAFFKPATVSIPVSEINNPKPIFTIAPVSTPAIIVNTAQIVDAAPIAAAPVEVAVKTEEAPAAGPVVADDSKIINPLV